MSGWTKRILAAGIVLAVYGIAILVTSEGVAKIVGGIILILIAWAPIGIYTSKEESSHELVLQSLFGVLVVIFGLKELGIWLPYVYLGALLILFVVAIYKLLSMLRRDQPESPGQ